MTSYGVNVCICIVKRIYKSKRKEFHAHDKSTRSDKYKVQYKDYPHAWCNGCDLFSASGFSSAFVYIFILELGCILICAGTWLQGLIFRAPGVYTYRLSLLVSNFENENICSTIEIKSKPVHLYTEYINRLQEDRNKTVHNILDKKKPQRPDAASVSLMNGREFLDSLTNNCV